MNLAIFASGSGTNAHRIIQHFKNHPKIRVSLIVSNNPNAGVLKIAESSGIDKMIVGKPELVHPGFSQNLRENWNIDWIALAGFLLLIPRHIIEAFPQKIVNIHPALLPGYGGKGMYGNRVHQAVSESGDQLSGMTIHYVNENYDEGTIIFKASVSLDNPESPQRISEQVLSLEHRFYPLVIEALMQG